MRVGLQRTWPPLPRVPEAVGRGARRRRHALAPPRRLLEWPTGPSSAARRSAAVPLLLGCSCVRAEDAPSVGRAACDAFVRPCSDTHVCLPGCWLMTMPCHTPVGAMMACLPSCGVADAASARGEPSACGVPQPCAAASAPPAGRVWTAPDGACAAASGVWRV